MTGKPAALIWFATILLAAAFLSACVRPIPGGEESQESAATIAAPLPADTGIATAVVTTAPDAYPAPTEPQPESPDATAAPDQDADTGAGDTSPEQPPDGEATAEPTQPPTPATDTVHVVQAGETLFIISQRYGVSIDEIASANNLADINRLDVGQQLVIPAPGTVTTPVPATAPAGQEQVHIVQVGDTLFSIGQRYGFTVSELAAYNGLANPNQLKVGQEIRIPPGS